MSLALNGTNGVTYNDGTLQSSAPVGRNRIINGNMQVWQRGTSFASGTGTLTYTADRFAVFATGASVAATQVSGPAGYKYAFQITGAASNTNAQLYQRIESLNCSDLSGATITISVNLASSSPQTVGWALQFPTASDNYTSTTAIGSGTWSVTSTATTFTATVTNLPAGVLNGMQLIIGANTFGAFTSGTLTVTGVQLETGTTATDFENLQYGQQLALCQRYYENWTSAESGEARVGVGMATATNTFKTPYTFKVQKRAAPAIAFSVASTFASTRGTGIDRNTSSLSAANTTSYGTNIVATTTETEYTPGGYAVTLFSAGGTSCFITFSAEL